MEPSTFRFGPKLAGKPRLVVYSYSSNPVLSVPKVFANYIGGQYIAGIVYILQEIANLNEGFITAIDYEKGEFRVGGDFNNPTTGVRVVINDPGLEVRLLHRLWLTVSHSWEIRYGSWRLAALDCRHR